MKKIKSLYVYTLVSMLGMFTPITNYAMLVDDAPASAGCCSDDWEWPDVWFPSFSEGAYAIDNHDGTVTSHNFYIGNMAEDGEPVAYEILGDICETITLAEFYQNYAQTYVLYADWSAAVSVAIKRHEDWVNAHPSSASPDLVIPWWLDSFWFW
jgi:hypothetical protein